MSTNFENGVNNHSRTDLLSKLQVLDPSVNHSYFNDFDIYTAGDWTVTETDSAATQAITNEDGGVLLITNTASDDDLVGLQGKETFKFESGKELFFKTRFKVSDATDSDLVIGLQITDATPLAVTDGVYFRKDDGDANLDFVVVKDSTATTSTAITTLSDDTYITIGFYYDGIDKIEYFAGSDSVSPVYLGKSVVTNLPDNEDLAVSFAIQNGEAAAKTMSIDYIFASKARR